MVEGNPVVTRHVTYKDTWLTPRLGAASAWPSILSPNDDLDVVGSLLDVHDHRV